jgi:eukaryotic-like serine/threonine-protein kinase
MTTDVLTRHEYQIVAGTYRLGRLLTGSDKIAIYETEYGEARRPAWIELRRGDTPDAEHRLGLWRETLKLTQNDSQPNLIRLYTTGASALNELPVIYLVMERADDSLAGVLNDRALSEEETREMLEPTLSALRFLHKNGYVHGGLDSSNVLAIGESLKLSTDKMERISDGAAPADDMWALGSVLVEALTRNVPNPSKDAGTSVLPETPEPIRAIVRHCLDPDPARRWTADQALEFLHLRSAGTPVAIEQNGLHSAGPRLVNQRPVKSEPRKESRAIERKPRDYRKWIYGPLAGLLLIATVIGISRRADRVPAGTPASSEVSKAPAPLPTIPEAEAPKATEGPQTGEAKSGKTVAPAGDRRANGWAVVVAAYGARGPADKRVSELAKRWPRFKFDVFEPASEKARHMVVIGTNLSEDNAKALRARAIASGLPRDTYIKRFATGQE